LGHTVAKQLFGTRRILFLAAGVLAIMALVPGMPHLAFVVLAVLLGGIAYNLPEAAAQQAEDAPTLVGPELERAEVEALLPYDLLQVELGYELVSMVHAEQDGSLMSRVAGLRKQIAQDLGVIVPPIHMRDNIQISPGAYRVLLSGTVLGSGTLRMGKLMAMSGGHATAGIPGEQVLEPAFQNPALWIDPADRQRAELSGYTVVEPSVVIATHLSELISTSSHELLGRRELQELLDLHGRANGRVIEELVPNLMSHSQLIRVLRNLLKERISIRDFRTILEALADNAGEVKDADQLTEHVRQRLAKQLTARAEGSDGKVHALVLSPAVEGTFRRLQSGQVALDPTETQRLADAFEAAATAHAAHAEAPVILCAAELRRTVATFSGRYMPGLSVMSFRELVPTAQVHTLGVIGEHAPPHKPGMKHAP
jgi:flagellar biosynthesis protein FlhA